MPEIVLNAATMEPFEIGAILFAALCYPGDDEVKKREEARIAYCGLYVAEEVNLDPLVKDQPGYAAYADLDRKTMTRRAHFMTARFRQRMAAARIARGFFYQATNGGQPPLPAGMKRFSITEMTKFVLPDTSESDPENVKRRVWARSKPILHLASAADRYGQMVRNGNNDFRFEIADLDAHREIVKIACEHEEIIAYDKRFWIKPDIIISLRWVE